jgi:hypothetical protein
MARSTHYTPPLSRFIVSALYHEAKARKIPMTRLANNLIELASTQGFPMCVESMPVRSSPLDFEVVGVV